MDEITIEEAQELDRVREQARALLGRLAAGFGAGSRLVRQCELAWAEAHRTAVASVLHGDYVNAAAILRDVVQGLAQAEVAASRGELPLDDIALLVRSRR